MKLRRGFHRIGLFGAVPCAVIAAPLIAWGAYLWATSPTPMYSVTGPDGSVIQFPDSMSYSEMRDALIRRYNRPIEFGYGAGKLDYPRNPGGDARNAAMLAGGAGLGALLIGGAWYLLSWAIGWIVAGFRDD